jgi:hypothetical protein
MLFINLNTRIINIINNNHDRCYIKVVLDENLKNAMYIPHRDVSKNSIFIQKNCFLVQLDPFFV